MEENNDILLDGFDALVYLANQYTKEKLLLSCKNIFIWYCRSVSTYFTYFRAIPIQRYSRINGIIIVLFKSCLN